MNFSKEDCDCCMMAKDCSICLAVAVDFAVQDLA